ncbi:glucan endo-1 3-beta-glucosidase, partial [Phtheirospermum japonicum]
CVIQASATSEKAQGFIDYACGIVDCAPIQPGGSCFDPDVKVVHASYALNLVYKNRGSCNLDIGIITTTDPCNKILFPFVNEYHIYSLLLILFITILTNEIFFFNGCIYAAYRDCKYP